MISNISRRYARAFFDVAKQENQIEQYFEELSQFASIFSRDKALRNFFANPVFEQISKRHVVDQLIAKMKLSEKTTNFLRLLVDKKRMDILGDIVTCYGQLMDEALKKVQVKLKTAFPLSDDLRSYICSNLERTLGKKVEMSVEEDPSLLGGVVIRVGDTLYDGSVRHQLNIMRNLLGEAR